MVPTTTLTTYGSYNPIFNGPKIIKFNDPQSQEVLNYLRQQNYQPTDLGGLVRGIKFENIEVGKGIYNQNNYKVSDEYYIHQWKETNDLTKEHPTGTHLVFKSYPEFFTKLRQVAEEKRKKW